MPTYTNPSTASALSASAAAAASTSTSEQQFLEQTPWANPNHPIHRLGRHAARSPLPETMMYSTATPAAQQKPAQYTPAPHGSGSASTIVENPTPQTDLASSAIKNEYGTTQHTNGISAANNRDGTMEVSPTETRRTINNMVMAGNSVQAQQTSSGAENTYAITMSSPLQARANLLTSLNRTASRAETKSPFRQQVTPEASAGGAGSGGGGESGMGRFGFR